MGPKLLQLLLALVIVGSATATYEELTKNCVKGVTTCSGFPADGTCSKVEDGFGKKGVCKAFISGFKVKGKTDEYRLTLAAKVGDAGEVTLRVPIPTDSAKDYLILKCFTKQSSPQSASSTANAKGLLPDKDSDNKPQLNGDWLICSFNLTKGEQTDTDVSGATAEIIVKSGSEAGTTYSQNFPDLLKMMDEKEIEPPKHTSDSNVILGPFFLVVTGAALVLHQVLQLGA